MDCNPWETFAGFENEQNDNEMTDNANENSEDAEDDSEPMSKIIKLENSDGKPSTSKQEMSRENKNAIDLSKKIEPANTSNNRDSRKSQMMENITNKGQELETLNQLAKDKEKPYRVPETDTFINYEECEPSTSKHDLNSDMEKEIMNKLREYRKNSNDFQYDSYSGNNEEELHREEQGKEEEDHDRQYLLPDSMDPRLWIIKCKVGEEEDLVHILINRNLSIMNHGRGPFILTAIAQKSLRGFIYVEAFSLNNVKWALKGIYGFNMTILEVPRCDMTKCLEVSKVTDDLEPGQWVRIKIGLYKGDLAQVIHTDESNMHATVNLVPRINYKSESKTKSKKGKQRMRCPARLFEPTSDKINGQKVIRMPGYFKFEGNIFTETGLLIKTFRISSLITRGIHPETLELELFSHACCPNPVNYNLLPGDKVTVIKGEMFNLTGEIVSVTTPTCKMLPDFGSNDEPIEFLEEEVAKTFIEGDYVKVTQGRYKGDTGYVMKVVHDGVYMLSDLSKCELKVLSQDLHTCQLLSDTSRTNEYIECGDVVRLPDNSIGIVTALKEDKFAVLDKDSHLVEGTIGTLEKMYFENKPTSIDARGNIIRTNSIVSVIDGCYTGFKAEVKYVAGYTLFLHSHMVEANNGFFICKTQNVILVGGSKGNEFPKNSSSSGDRHIARSQKSELPLGKMMKIIQGPYKDTIGTVKLNLGELLHVEMTSPQQIITIHKSHVVEWNETSKGNTSALNDDDFSSSTLPQSPTSMSLNYNPEIGCADTEICDGSDSDSRNAEILQNVGSNSHEFTSLASSENTIPSRSSPVSTNSQFICSHMQETGNNQGKENASDCTKCCQEDSCKTDLNVLTSLASNIPVSTEKSLDTNCPKHVQKPNVDENIQVNSENIVSTSSSGIPKDNIHPVPSQTTQNGNYNRVILRDKIPIIHSVSSPDINCSLPSQTSAAENSNSVHSKDLSLISRDSAQEVNHSVPSVSTGNDKEKIIQFSDSFQATSSSETKETVEFHASSVKITPHILTCSSENKFCLKFDFGEKSTTVNQNRKSPSSSTSSIHVILNADIENLTLPHNDNKSINEIVQDPKINFNTTNVSHSSSVFNENQDSSAQHLNKSAVCKESTVSNPYPVKGDQNSYTSVAAPDTTVIDQNPAGSGQHENTLFVPHHQTVENLQNLNMPSVGKDSKMINQNQYMNMPSVSQDTVVENQDQSVQHLNKSTVCKESKVSNNQTVTNNQYLHPSRPAPIPILNNQNPAGSGQLHNTLFVTHHQTVENLQNLNMSSIKKDSKMINQNQVMNMPSVSQDIIVENQDQSGQHLNKPTVCKESKESTGNHHPVRKSKHLHISFANPVSTVVNENSAGSGQRDNKLFVPNHHTTENLRSLNIPFTRKDSKMINQNQYMNMPAFSQGSVVENQDQSGQHLNKSTVYNKSTVSNNHPVGNSQLFHPPRPAPVHILNNQNSAGNGQLHNTLFVPHHCTAGNLPTLNSSSVRKDNKMINQKPADNSRYMNMPSVNQHTTLFSYNSEKNDQYVSPPSTMQDTRMINQNSSQLLNTSSVGQSGVIKQNHAANPQILNTPFVNQETRVINQNLSGNCQNLNFPSVKQKTEIINQNPATRPQHVNAPSSREDARIIHLNSTETSQPLNTNFIRQDSNVVNLNHAENPQLLNVSSVIQENRAINQYPAGNNQYLNMPFVSQNINPYANSQFFNVPSFIQDNGVSNPNDFQYQNIPPIMQDARKIYENSFQNPQYFNTYTVGHDTLRNLPISTIQIAQNLNIPITGNNTTEIFADSNYQHSRRQQTSNVSQNSMVNSQFASSIGNSDARIIFHTPAFEYAMQNNLDGQIFTTNNQPIAITSNQPNAYQVQPSINQVQHLMLQGQNFNARNVSSERCSQRGIARNVRQNESLQLSGKSQYERMDGSNRMQQNTFINVGHQGETSCAEDNRNYRPPTSNTYLMYHQSTDNLRQMRNVPNVTQNKQHVTLSNASNSQPFNVMSMSNHINQPLPLNTNSGIPLRGCITQQQNSQHTVVNSRGNNVTKDNGTSTHLYNPLTQNLGMNNHVNMVSYSVYTTSSDKRHRAPWNKRSQLLNSSAQSAGVSSATFPQLYNPSAMSMNSVRQPLPPPPYPSLDPSTRTNVINQRPFGGRP